MNLLPHSELLWAFNQLPNRFVVLETVTTGLFDLVGPPGCVSVGVSLIDGGSVVDGEEFPVRPHRPMETEASSLNGYSQAQVETHPAFADQWPRITPWLDDELIVIHNAAFDWPLLLTHCQRHDLPAPKASGVFCSQRNALLWALANGLPCSESGPALTTLAQALDVTTDRDMTQDQCGALLNCRLTATVIQGLQRQYADVQEISTSDEMWQVA